MRSISSSQSCCFINFGSALTLESFSKNRIKHGIDQDEVETDDSLYEDTIQYLDFRLLLFLCYAKALVQPGKSVRVIAYQSIGEHATQMTLNSVVWDTELVLNTGGMVKCFVIGGCVNGVMKKDTQTFENGVEYT